jgi:PKD repeat protein
LILPTHQQPILQQQWDFGDGTNSNNNDPQHYYTNPGTYYVCLFVVDFTNCSPNPTMQYCDSVTILPPCQASFTYLINGGTVSFTNTSSSDSATSDQFFYDFGDGNSSTSTNPNHVYASPGTYYVCLTIVDFANCSPNPTMQYCDSVTIYPPCQASFTYIINGDTAFFTNTSSSDSATSDQFFYDFGDGNSSTSTNPYYIYTSPGTYYVCLTVVDFDCNPNPTMQYCDSVTISFPCQASFGYNINGNTVDFFNTSSSDSASASQFEWNFGDGSTSNSDNPQHSFAFAGTYYVCLTIVDSNCNPNPTMQYCDSVVITTSIPPCQASFTYNANGTSVNFINTSTSDSTTASLWQWDFGDGTNSNNNEPEHIYAAPGTYYVCLFVVDFTACPTSPTMQYCDSVTVYAPCQASYNYTVNGGTVQFTNTSSSDSTTSDQFYYDFGDGTYSSSTNPAHTYTSVGTYYVCLLVVDFDCNPNPTMQYCDSITISSLVGIDDNQVSITNTSLFPNPVKDFIHLRFNSLKTQKITIHFYNILGSLIETQTKIVAKGENTSTFNVTAFSNGAYFVSILDEQNNPINRITFIK